MRTLSHQPSKHAALPKRQKLDACFSKGTAFYGAGLHAQAQPLLKKVVEHNPKHLDALIMLGAIASQANDQETASKYFSQAVLAAPQNHLALYNLGYTQQMLGKFDDALVFYNESLKAKPDYAMAWSNKGSIYKQKHQLQEALDSYEKAIQLDPKRTDDLINYALVLADLGHCNEALEVCDLAIQMGAKGHVIEFNRGFILSSLMRDDEAIEAYRRSIAMSPEYAPAHWNLSNSLLRTGKYKEGWQEFEWRWKTPLTGLRERDFHQPKWLGKENIKGKRILIHAEQGLGDTLQFCRYLKLVAELGATVYFEVQTPLFELMKTIDGPTSVYAQGSQLPEFDFHCPLMSLPLAFETEVNNIPASIPYIKADPIKVSYWKKIVPNNNRLKVGLVWSGGFRADQPATWAVNNRRNMPIHYLEYLNTIDADFYSLQKGEPAESELANVIANNWQGPCIHNPTINIKNFTDTAALIECLDVIISVDTSTAHLAGAMGKRVLLLNRFDTCWRWGINTNQTPWYPETKIIRQLSAGDWNSVLSQLISITTKRV